MFVGSRKEWAQFRPPESKSLCDIQSMLSPGKLCTQVVLSRAQARGLGNWNTELEKERKKKQERVVSGSPTKDFYGYKASGVQCQMQLRKVKISQQKKQMQSYWKFWQM